MKKQVRHNPYRVVCRDCDMTAEELEQKLAEINKENPDYTEWDFWCDHERDCCPGGE